MDIRGYLIVVPCLVVCFISVSALPPLDNVKVDDLIPEEFPSASAKGRPRPPYLSNAKPSVFTHAAAVGDVGGLFAANNNTLISVAGPNTNAIASLNSTTSYYAKPINETSNSTNPDATLGTSLGGFIVAAEENTNAYAAGDYIQYINQGASYITGLGESVANGTTENEDSSVAGHGFGWKDIPNGENTNPTNIQQFAKPAM